MSRRACRLRWLVILMLVWAPASGAHEVRPAYLSLTETADGHFDVLWKVPRRGGRALALTAVLPAHCQTTLPPRTTATPGAQRTRWAMDCGSEGLRDQPVRIEGLADTLVDTLVRITWRNGRVDTYRVRPDSPAVTLAGDNASIGAYLAIGIEHILGGIDHLLFVLCLVLLVPGVRRLVATVTAFTVAHSITLALAALGVVAVPGAPVEAVIALSIVFLARELLRPRADDIAWQAPWVVAFVFGLLHGFGFAGALHEVGLPPNAIPSALLLFNVGVEIGQLLFIAGVLAVIALWRRWARPVAWAPALTAYGAGGVAMFWVLERGGAVLFG